MAAADDKSAVGELVAVRGVRVDGARTRPGKRFQVNEREGERLVAIGAARLPTKDEDVVDGADGSDAEERADAIRFVVETKLTDADWTQDGTPKVAAVRAASGYEDVSADELAPFKREPAA